MAINHINVLSKLGYGTGSLVNNGSGLSSSLPSLGSGLDSIFGFVNSLFNANQARKNRQFQERMYNKQVEDNLKFWKIQQDYNLPSAVRQRLEDAGLNPLLMYEGGTSGLVANTMPASGSAPSGSAASGTMSSNFAGGFTQAALLRAQIANINADTQQKIASAENTQQSTSNLNLQWKFDKDTFHIRKLIEYGNYDLALSQMRQYNANVFNQDRMTTGTLINLQYINENLVKRFHLDSYKAAQEVLGMWENIKIGKDNVAIGWKNAATNWLNALTAAKVGTAQSALMYANANQLKKLTPLLVRSQRLTNQGAQIANFRNALGIYSDIMNMSKTQAETFRLNFETGIMQGTGLGIGQGVLQQTLALPVVTFGSALNNLFNH